MQGHHFGISSSPGSPASHPAPCLWPGKAPTWGPITMHAAPGWNHSVPALLHVTLPELQGKTCPLENTASYTAALSLPAWTGLLIRCLTTNPPGTLLHRWLEGKQNQSVLPAHPAPLAPIRMELQGQASIDGAHAPLHSCRVLQRFKD